MRIFVSGLIAVFILASCAFATDVAPGGTATCGPTSGVGCNLGGTHPASNAIDGLSNTQWIAPSDAVDPYVLVALAQPSTVDYVTVEGVGNAGYYLTFEIFVGTSSSVSTLMSSGTDITGGPVTITGTGGSPGWSDTYTVSTASPIDYVLYYVTASNGNSGGAAGTYDDAYVQEIVVDAVPEPVTLGLFGAGLLALGFARRFRIRK
jgi:hypothetical protein